MEQRKARAVTLSFSVESLIARDKNTKERRRSCESPQHSAEKVPQLCLRPALKPEPEEGQAAWATHSEFSHTRKFIRFY